MALPRENRLRRSSDINRVYSRGRRGFGQTLFVRSLDNGLPGSRAVVIVGKKVSKKAVVRNKIRRQLTDQLAQEWKDLTSGQDIVVYVREDLSKRPAEAAKELGSALVKAGALIQKGKQ